MSVSSFEELEVWKFAMTFAKSVYRLTSHFPAQEQFGLTNQLCRAAVSIASNIAEGWGRGPGAANLNFARLARGSACEARTQLLLANELGFADRSSIDLALREMTSLQRLINAYIKGMERAPSKCDKTNQD